MAGRKVLPLKRRREGKTNYKRRLSLLKSGKPRVVVRISNNYITLQLVEFNGTDKTKFSYTSKKLSEFGWDYSKKNLPAAYLTGLVFGLICKKNKIEEGIFDIGVKRVTKGNKLFSVLKGCLDSGLKIPCSTDIFPSESRIRGEHISENIPKKFDEVKKNILNKYGK